MGPGMEPAKKTAAALAARDAYLRAKGYIDNPRDLLYNRFHGTSAERQREQNSARAAAQRASMDQTTPEQEKRIFRNCWRTGRPIPDWLQQKLEEQDAAEQAHAKRFYWATPDSAE